MCEFDLSVVREYLLDACRSELFVDLIYNCFVEMFIRLQNYFLNLLHLHEYAIIFLGSFVAEEICVKKYLAFLFVGFIFCFPLFSFASESDIATNYFIAAPGFSTAEETVHLLWDVIEENYSEFFSPVDIVFSESSIIVYVEKRGMASELKAAYEQGADEDFEPWVQYKNNFLSTYNSLADFVVNTYRDDIAFEIWLINDDLRADKRSPFPKYLAYASSRDYVWDLAMLRYDENEQIPSELPDEIIPLYICITEQLEELGFDYASVFYNKDSKRFIIEVSISNVGENLFSAKQAGYDETYLPWMELKSFLDKTYVTMLNYLEIFDKKDISIIFQLVNDEVFIEENYDRLDFTPLYVISNVVIPEGMVVIDIMEK